MKGCVKIVLAALLLTTSATAWADLRGIRSIWRLDAIPLDPELRISNQSKPTDIANLVPDSVILTDQEIVVDGKVILPARSILVRVDAGEDFIFCSWSQGKPPPEKVNVNWPGNLLCLKDKDKDNRIDTYFNKFSMNAPLFAFFYSKLPEEFNVQDISYSFVDRSVYQSGLKLAMTINGGAILNPGISISLQVRNGRNRVFFDGKINVDGTDGQQTVNIIGANFTLKKNEDGKFTINRQGDFSQQHFSVLPAWHIFR